MQVAPSQLSPGENFDIFFFIRNHTDSTTYYIRAVIYDVRTGEVLSTTNLSQAATNSRLFSTTVQAPSDSTGTGRNIIAVATVYTDSGYTTKSTDYEEQEQYYLIRAVAPLVFGGGGGIDPRTIREIIQEEVQNGISRIPKPQQFPDMPFDTLFGALGSLQREVNRIPKELFDGTKIGTRLGAIQKQIAGLPSPEKTDLAPVLSQFATLLQILQSTSRETRLTGSTLVSEQRAALNRIVDQVAPIVRQAMKETVAKHHLTIPFSDLLKERSSAAGTPSHDISHLVV